MASIEQFETPSAAPAQMRAIRSLLDEAFAGDFSDDDWDHTLGGLHVVVTEDGNILSHAALVPRTIEIARRPFAAGYVEGVATAPARQGEGLGTRAMAAINGALPDRFGIGVLSTSAHRFYERLGWERWEGPSYVRDGDEIVRTGDEDAGIMVLRVGPSAAVDLTSSITCRSRAGDDW